MFDKVLFLCIVILCWFDKLQAIYLEGKCEEGWVESDVKIEGLWGWIFMENLENFFKLFEKI